MSERGPLSAIDAEHLRLLSIFHLVVAVICGLYGLMAVGWAAFSLAVFSHVPPPGPHGQPVPAEILWMIAVFGVVFLLASIAGTTLMILSSRWLEARTHYLFCFVVACVSLLVFPFATVLGVFTLIVLSRPQVKAAFSGSGASP